MSYRDVITDLSAASEAEALALYTAYEAGGLDEDEFVTALAVLITGHNARAVTVADLALAASVTVALRRPVPPLGLLPAPGDPARLVKAGRTLVGALDDTPDPAARVARLARSEPLTTGARTYSEGMAKSEHVTAWVRGLSAAPCQLCTYWYRDGRVWPADHSFPTHKGCSCQPVVTVIDRAPRPVQR